MTTQQMNSACLSMCWLSEGRADLALHSAMLQQALKEQLAKWKAFREHFPGVPDHQIEAGDHHESTTGYNHSWTRTVSHAFSEPMFGNCYVLWDGLKRGIPCHQDFVTDHIVPHENHCQPDAPEKESWNRAYLLEFQLWSCLLEFPLWRV